MQFDKINCYRSVEVVFVISCDFFVCCLRMVSVAGELHVDQEMLSYGRSNLRGKNPQLQQGVLIPFVLPTPHVKAESKEIIGLCCSSNCPSHFSISFFLTVNSFGSPIRFGLPVGH